MNADLPEKYVFDRFTLLSKVNHQNKLDLVGTLSNKCATSTYAMALTTFQTESLCQELTKIVIY